VRSVSCLAPAASPWRRSRHLFLCKLKPL
jgi:hypothetical protein